MSFHPYVFNYGDWDCVPLDPIPDQPGVYAIVVKIKDGCWYELVYIGSSSNLRRRIKNHPLVRHFRKNAAGFRVHFRATHLDYKKLEVALIKHHAPLMNIQHNSNG